ncbi:syndecan-4 [Astyanax mexicanus]|uniref:Syndecan n=2 Tax=Astyanax mexicanus TaxID=7994 RepID=A0A8B9H3S7_ASTMX|nr:syndecan-4 [Astyanax mexicanus]KAG9277694.1 syndecan-4 [Astyanax mexicanus]
MLRLYLALLFFAASVFAESVRETETRVRSKKVGLHVVDMESSGDFDFANEELATIDDKDEDQDDDQNYDDYEESGSGVEDVFVDSFITSKPYLTNNFIPEVEPSQPRAEKDNELELVQQNEIAHSFGIQHNKAEQNIFNRTEVLAAVIAGGAVGLLFAVLLILLLVYRMKKKDEGSYDLGKKPIYKKAPTTEIYA